MGCRLPNQRRGHGSPKYRSLKNRAKGDMRYPSRERTANGQVIALEHDALHYSPVVKIMWDDFSNSYMIAAEGIKVGDWITVGDEIKASRGSATSIGSMPEGTEVYNVELHPGDGGQFVRSSGTFASIVSHDRKTGLTYVKLPSKKIVPIKSRCYATVGRAAGGGRKEKAYVHAGQVYHAKRAKHKVYPKVGGTSMNAADHPHGGGRHPHVGRPTTISRNTPPGRKVGHIAARRTGKRKR
ncbi:MAG: 50S ribosomal protein L2 [Candidatus Altiarchaeota archaeon]